MVRRCYRSKWRLHPGESTLTEGRFFFVDDTVPAFPGSHLLGSRDWTDATERETTAIPVGEWEGERTFHNGEAPLVRPVPRIVGSVECVESGGGGGDLIPADVLGLDRFYPPLCYETLTPAPWHRFLRCPDLFYIANVMFATFEFPNPAKTLAQILVGAGSVATHFPAPAGDRYSSSTVCVLGNEAWQWADGTRNAGQFLAQSYGTAGGPTSYGRYGATPIYNQYATELLSRFTAAGAFDCTRWVLVGHSYGGAAAAVAAARLKMLYPERSVSLLTFGAPRAGDARLIALLRGVDQLHVRRPLDPIPYLPPQFAEANTAGVLSFLFWRGWGEYASYERRRTITPTGFRDELPGEGPTNDVWTAILTNIESGVLSNYEEHSMLNYTLDISTWCEIGS